MKDLHALAREARAAAWELAACPLEKRNAALNAMAETLLEDRAEIFQANQEDLRRAQEEGLAAPLVKRLGFGEEKLNAVVEGLRALCALPDPIGRTTLSRELTPGLNLYRVTCPIGVIGVIFESRPDALVQIASLCLKKRQCRPAQGRPGSPGHQPRPARFPDPRPGKGGTSPGQPDFYWKPGKMWAPCSRRMPSSI